jgi:hypothetical protein
VSSHNLSVDQGLQNAVSVFPDSTNASLARRNSTVLTAEMAFDLAVSDLVVEHRFLHATPRFGFLMKSTPLLINGIIAGG